MMGCVAALASPAPRFATGSSVPAKNSTETVLKLRRMIGPIVMTPTAGQAGSRFTLRARRVCGG
ncbi:hypothetical protein K6W36_11280 [Acetobacter senegalensis]|uniref:hypothetical protein n=1 Tax=Acetobacter senegalensis TaxID=446692 RepID=UPI000A97D72A|nr:hypothetical protein [Acetobacter senegalensis]MCG4261151.1 hypothetical protein [Acetobacter senegalensis]